MKYFFSFHNNYLIQKKYQPEMPIFDIIKTMNLEAALKTIKMNPTMYYVFNIRMDFKKCNVKKILATIILDIMKICFKKKKYGASPK